MVKKRAVFLYCPNLKTRKNNNMPLDPKQQPPYYTPGTSGQTLNKYQRINAQFNAVTTTGTTETDLYLYTLPANSLITNGDGLLIEFTAQNTAGTSDSHIHRLYIDAVNQIAFDNSADTSITRLSIQIIKISSTQIKIIATCNIEVGTTLLVIQTANSLDFTDTIPIKFTGQCNGDGVIQTYSLTIDKIII